MIKSMKQLNEALMRRPAKGSRGMSNSDRKLNALMEHMNALTKEVKMLRNGNVKPVQEEYMKIKVSDYNNLIELAEDMNYKIDEQNAIIKNYESLVDFNQLDEETDASINQILEELSESIDELNKTTNVNNNDNYSYNSYVYGADTALGIMNEHIQPILNNLNDFKATVLAESKQQKPQYYYIPQYYSNLNNFDQYELNEALEQLDNINNSIKNQTILDTYKSLVESKIANMPNKNVIMNILNEASGDISIANTDYGYEARYPQYENFSKRVNSLLNDAFSKSKGNKSDMAVIPEENWDFMSKAQNAKFDLPIANPEKWNVTIKSAIANLSEALTDLDGKLNLNLCKKAYLYHKTSNPQTIKDFAMPIAVFNEADQKLYAHPTLIKNTANILKNETCMKTYDIGSRQQLYALRESLIPYLNKIGMKAPWIEENLKNLNENENWWENFKKDYIPDWFKTHYVTVTTSGFGDKDTRDIKTKVSSTAPRSWFENNPDAAVKSLDISGDASLRSNSNLLDVNQIEKNIQSGVRDPAQYTQFIKPDTISGNITAQMGIVDNNIDPVQSMKFIGGLGLGLTAAWWLYKKLTSTGKITEEDKAEAQRIDAEETNKGLG